MLVTSGDRALLEHSWLVLESVWLPQVRKWSGEKNSSRSGKCQGILGQGRLAFWRKVRENWNCKTDLMPLKVRRNDLGPMSSKGCCNRRLEAATISEILRLFGQGNLTFIREKSGNFKTEVCGNHEFCLLQYSVFSFVEPLMVCGNLCWMSPRRRPSSVWPSQKSSRDRWERVWRHSSQTKPRFSGRYVHACVNNDYQLCLRCVKNRF